jgi:hypothetical protein
MHMSATTIPSSGTAKRIASRKRRARASSVPQVAARTSCRRSASPSSGALAHLGAERRAGAAAVLGEHEVGGVVLRRVLGVEVDREQLAGCGCAKFWVCTPSRSEPTAITRSASSQRRPTGSTCGGIPTAHGWPEGSRPDAP